MADWRFASMSGPLLWAAPAGGGAGNTLYSELSPTLLVGLKKQGDILPASYVKMSTVASARRTDERTVELARIGGGPTVLVAPTPEEATRWHNMIQLALSDTAAPKVAAPSAVQQPFSAPQLPLPIAASSPHVAGGLSGSAGAPTGPPSVRRPPDPLSDLAKPHATSVPGEGSAVSSARNPFIIAAGETPGLVGLRPSGDPTTGRSEATQGSGEALPDSTRHTGREIRRRADSGRRLGAPNWETVESSRPISDLDVAPPSSNGVPPLRLRSAVSSVPHQRSATPEMQQEVFSAENSPAVKGNFEERELSNSELQRQEAATKERFHDDATQVDRHSGMDSARYVAVFKSTPPSSAAASVSGHPLDPGGRGALLRQAPPPIPSTYSRSPSGVISADRKSAWSRLENPRESLPSEPAPAVAENAAPANSSSQRCNPASGGAITPWVGKMPPAVAPALPSATASSHETERGGNRQLHQSSKSSSDLSERYPRSSGAGSLRDTKGEHSRRGDTGDAEEDQTSTGRPSLKSARQHWAEKPDGVTVTSHGDDSEDGRESKPCAGSARGARSRPDLQTASHSSVSDSAKSWQRLRDPSSSLPSDADEDDGGSRHPTAQPRSDEDPRNRNEPLRLHDGGRLHSARRHSDGRGPTEQEPSARSSAASVQLQNGQPTGRKPEELPIRSHADPQPVPKLRRPPSPSIEVDVEPCRSPASRDCESVDSGAPPRLEMILTIDDSTPDRESQGNPSSPSFRRPSPRVSERPLATDSAAMGNGVQQTGRAEVLAPVVDPTWWTPRGGDTEVASEASHGGARSATADCAGSHVYDAASPISGHGGMGAKPSESSSHSSTPLAKLWGSRNESGVQHPRAHQGTRPTSDRSGSHPAMRDIAVGTDEPLTTGRNVGGAGRIPLGNDAGEVAAGPPPSRGRHARVADESPDCAIATSPSSLRYGPSTSTYHRNGGYERDHGADLSRRPPLYHSPSRHDVSVLTTRVTESPLEVYRPIEAVVSAVPRQGSISPGRSRSMSMLDGGRGHPSGWKPLSWRDESPSQQRGNRASAGRSKWGEQDLSRGLHGAESRGWDGRVARSSYSARGGAGLEHERGDRLGASQSPGREGRYTVSGVRGQRNGRASSCDTRSSFRLGSRSDGDGRLSTGQPPRYRGSSPSFASPPDAFSTRSRYPNFTDSTCGRGATRRRSLGDLERTSAPMRSSSQNRDGRDPSPTAWPNQSNSRRGVSGTVGEPRRSDRALRRPSPLAREREGGQLDRLATGAQFGRRSTSTPPEELANLRRKWNAVRQVLLEPRQFTKHTVRTGKASEQEVFMTADNAYVVCVSEKTYRRKGKSSGIYESIGDVLDLFGDHCKAIALNSIERVSLGSEEEFVLNLHGRFSPERLVCIISSTHAFLLEAFSADDAGYLVSAWEFFLYNSKPRQ